MTISPPLPAAATPSIPETAYGAWSPELKLLVGDEAKGPLSALVETASGELLSFRPRQVNHQPSTTTGAS